MADVTNISGRINSISQEGVAVVASQTLDERKNKKQGVINQENDEELANHGQRIGTLEQEVGTGGSVDERIAQAKSEAESDIKGGASSDYDTLKKTEDAIKAEVNAREGAVSDEASARQDAINTAKTEIIGGASTDCNTLGKAETKISTNAQDIAQLQAAYEALTESDVVVVAPTDTWPVAAPQQNTIYRVADRVNTPPQNYSDYMYNGTAMVLMATYNNAIDPRPKKGSQNLVSSGGVFDNMGALDVSELNATENPHTLATYADLSAALAAIPSDYQKGGMSIKFVQSSDNKYVQYRLMSNTWSTTVSDWQGVDDEPTDGSDNLVNSGGLYNNILGLYNLVSQDVTLNYYLAPNGQIQPLTNFFYSNPLPVYNGTVFTANDISANSAQSGLLLLSWVQSDGTLISKILNPNSAGTYVYTFEKSGYVCISGAKSDIPKFTLQHDAIKNRVKRNEDSISIFDNELFDSRYRLNNDNVVSDKYISPSAVIESYQNYFYSNPIAVFKGNIFTANDVSDRSAKTGVAMLAWVDSEGNPISKILNPNGAGTYTYTFAEDGFVSISGHKNDINKFYIDGFSLKENVSRDEKKILIHDEKITELNGEIDSLDEEINAVSSHILNESEIVSNHYRNPQGLIYELNNFFYSNPIKVVKGCVFTANNVSQHSAQTGVAMLSWVTSDNVFISKILNPDGAGTYTYTFNDSGYVSISGRTGDLSKFSIQYPSQKDRFEVLETEEIEIEGRVSNLEDTIDTNDRLIKLTTNPVEKIRYDCGLFAIFKTVGVIGDSLASGEMQGYHQDGTKYYADMYELSWGQQLAKMTGVDVFNFSYGGLYAKAWMLGNNSRTWDANDIAGGAHSNKKQCYFIGLAHNDYTMVNNGTYTAGIGTVSDINDSDYTQNADSYVGWYARIIQAVKSIEPRAYIFCITPPDHTYDDYSAQIRNIVNHFNGQRVYLIDLATYGTPHDATWRRMGNHLSAAGYLYHAYEIANYVDWIIRKNGNDFKYTSLVGTDIYDTDPNQ